MHYRLYQPGDFTQLYAIEESCFEPPLRFPRAYMRQLVSSSRAVTWVAEEQGVLAGFAIADWLQEPAGVIGYIETIEVAAARRMQGIGGELLCKIEESGSEVGTQSIWLHVDAENASAIRIYEAHGYKLLGREEDYYAHHRAALVYAKLLPAESQTAFTGSA